VGATVVVCALRVEVAEDDPRARLLADPDRLADGAQVADALVAGAEVAVVRVVDPVVLGRHLRDRNDLVGRCVVPRDVEQPRGETERALVHPLTYQGAHPLELGVSRLAVFDPNHRVANRTVADVCEGVDADALLAQRGEQRGDVRGAAPVDPYRDRRDPLIKERARVARIVELEHRRRVHVDEAGCHHQPCTSSVSRALIPTASASPTNVMRSPVTAISWTIGADPDPS